MKIIKQFRYDKWFEYQFGKGATGYIGVSDEGIMYWKVISGYTDHSDANWYRDRWIVWPSGDSENKLHINDAIEVVENLKSAKNLLSFK